MFKPQYLLIVGLLVTGCGPSTQNTSQAVDSGTIGSQPKVTVEKQQLTGNSLKDSVLGIWTNGADMNASFMIEQDSILYADSEEPKHKYDLVGDQFKIHYDDSVYACKVYFKKDTMIMESPEYGAVKYWKFKD